MDEIIFRNFRRNFKDLECYNLPAEIAEEQRKYLNESVEFIERVNELLWHTH